MILRRQQPRILAATKPVAPSKSAYRVTPRTKQARGPVVGRCLSCGETFTGPGAVRLRHGCVRQRKWGAEFIELPFEDKSKAKWVCLRCAWECDITDDSNRRFSKRLKDMRPNGQCVLCHQCINPVSEKDWSSAVLIELGETAQSTRGSFSIFRPLVTGHVHYFCMDELKLQLWRLIETTDIPDYREYLQCT